MNTAAAAGIDCDVRSPFGSPGVVLPGGVQSALGWVVRETTTNVLRHGDARRCAIAVREEEGAVLLTVENDGAGSPSGIGGSSGIGVSSGIGGGPGSGLAGLRERLAAVGGSLEAGPGDGGTFLVTARVPVPRTPGMSPMEVAR